MASNLIIVCAFVFVGWCAINCYAFPKASDDVKKPLDDQSFETKCLPGLGCFYNGPPFYDRYLRPVSKLPFDLEDMHTKFYLYSSRSERTLLEPNKESLEKSSYNASRGLQFFIHGYFMTFTPRILAIMEGYIDNIRKAGRQNTILVDWTVSNQKPYAQAVANGRVVGAQVAQLVQFLQNATGLDAKDVHIIGHSLGAHVVGFAGKRIPKLGRATVIPISPTYKASEQVENYVTTGLDPAGPYFMYGEPEIRLDHEDADFVDIIHTHASNDYKRGSAILDPIGDMDFYPNGGRCQPGCPEFCYQSGRPETQIDIEYGDVVLGNDEEGLRTEFTPNCHHVRAMDYFFESAKNPDCKFIATQCSSYSTYERGKCSQFTEAEMGYFAQKNPSVANGFKYFLKTSDKSPFCIQKRY